VNQQQLSKQCKALVTSQWWSALDDLLSLWVEQELGLLCRTTDLGQMRESQGKIKAFRILRALPEEIDRLQREARLIK
jgi:hypothetical protein